MLRGGGGLLVFMTIRSSRYEQESGVLYMLVIVMLTMLRFAVTAKKSNNFPFKLRLGYVNAAFLIEW